MTNPEDKVESLGSDIEPLGAGVEPLGADFEVIEDPGTEAAASPASAPGAAASAASLPVLSTEAWTGLGLGLAIGGLLGPWGGGGSFVIRGDHNLVHGLLLAWTVWHLLVSSLAAVNRTNRRLKPTLPGLLVVYGAARLALAGGDAAADLLGWQATSMAALLGPVFTVLGGLVVLAAKGLGKAKDAKLPPVTGAPVDDQFSKSLLAYLMITVGLLLPWGSAGDRGVDSIFGMLTLACVVMGLWSSWVGAWKHWAMPIVTGKMGLILFLAPTEAFILGLMGIIRHLTDGESGIIGMTREAWPSASALPDMPEPFLVFGGGAVLTLLGSAFAFYELFHGAKAAMEQTKQRKEAEREARKSKRGGGRSKSASDDKAGAKKKASERKTGDKKDRKKSRK